MLYLRCFFCLFWGIVYFNSIQGVLVFCVPAQIVEKNCTKTFELKRFLLKLHSILEKEIDPVLLKDTIIF